MNPEWCGSKPHELKSGHSCLLKAATLHGPVQNIPTVMLGRVYFECSGNFLFSEPSRMLFCCGKRWNTDISELQCMRSGCEHVWTHVLCTSQRAWEHEYHEYHVNRYFLGYLFFFLFFLSIHLKDWILFQQKSKNYEGRPQLKKTQTATFNTCRS